MKLLHIHLEWFFTNMGYSLHKVHGYTTSPVHRDNCNGDDFKLSVFLSAVESRPACFDVEVWAIRVSLKAQFLSKSPFSKERKIQPMGLSMRGWWSAANLLCVICYSESSSNVDEWNELPSIKHEKTCQKTHFYKATQAGTIRAQHRRTKNACLLYEQVWKKKSHSHHGLNPPRRNKWLVKLYKNSTDQGDSIFMCSF